MHKNKNLFLFAFFALLFGTLVLAPDAHAQVQYTLLEKIPGFNSVNGADLPGYVKAIYNLSLVIVTLSAVLMISIGGFMYLTSAGNTSSMGTAKTIIYDSLIGLVIALVSWLVLNVINPDLTNVSVRSLLQIPAPAPASPGSQPIQPSPTADLYTHAEAVALLSGAGIGVTSSGNCSDPQNRQCTSLENIPKSTIANLINLKNVSGCSFNVTGGTETGHVSHGFTYPVVDISESSCMASHLQNARANGTLESTDKIVKICATRDQRVTAYKCSTVEAAPHFHLVFKP